jgi:DNA-binding transcriptional MerR regulator
MKIGEVAARTGVTPRMLRYYETQGLISSERHLNGYREYTESHLHQIRSVRDLTRSGVPTRFIKIILDREAGTTAWTPNCDDILAKLVRTEIASLSSKIACLTMSRDSLTQFLDDTATLLETLTPIGAAASR